MVITEDSFIEKVVSFTKNRIAPRLTEESNKVMLGVKAYFMPKKIKELLSAPEVKGMIFNQDGMIDISVLEGAIASGFECGSKYPFLGVCYLDKSDAMEFIMYIKGESTEKEVKL